MGHALGWREPGESEAVEAGRNRIALAATAFVLLFSVLGVRLVALAMTGGEDLSFLHAKREADRPRADIVDRRGTLLATDVTVAAAYADPSKVWDAEVAAAKLSSVLPHLDQAKLARRLGGKGRFVWIDRELTPQQKFDIHNLGLPGIGFVPERKRFYPHGAVAAHMLGYVDIDGRGIAGVEMALNAAIEGRSHADEAIALSLDLRVQHSLHNELMSAMETFRAKAAAGIILHAETGEIVAMASLPSFDPNAPGGSDANAKFNRITAGVYELGSTLKAFTVATALDTRTVSLEDGYDATDPITYGRFRIRDFHAEERYLTVPEIFLHSSNIGSAKMALDYGIEVQRDYLGRFGLLRRPTLELHETAQPLLPQRWGELESMTIAYGHGIAISPLSLAVGSAALVNGGCMVTPTILKVHSRSRACERVISQQTSEIMRELMRDSVALGTGGRADVEGFPVAGKTGTAEKAGRGGYRRKDLISSFLGVFPSHDPDYVVLIVLDEPRGTKETFGYATAGWTAAPVTAKVVARVAPMLGITPVMPHATPSQLVRMLKEDGPVARPDIVVAPAPVAEPETTAVLMGADL